MRILIKYTLAVFAATPLIIGCGGDTEFPSLNAADHNATIYYVRAVEDDYEIWSVAGDETINTGLRACAGSRVAVGGGSLYYSRDDAIYRGQPGGVEEIVVGFPGGECREVAENRDTAREYVAGWEVRNLFRDIVVSPDSRELAFVLEQVIKPLADEKIKDFDEDGIAGFMSRADRYFDSGVYVISIESGDKTYLGPGKEVFTFPESGTLIFEDNMVPVRMPSGGGDPIPLITSDRYEYGWVPQIDYNGGAGALVAQQSDEDANEVINYVYRLDDYAVSGKYRIKYVEGTDRAIGVAVSPDGEFVVVSMRTDRLGNVNLMVGSMDDGDLVTAVSGGMFLEFLPSGNGFFYYLEGDKPGRGDIFACGLDGEVAPVTDTGDVIPPGFIR